MESFTVPLAKDNNLLALKLSLDNAVLETKARERNMNFTP